MAVNKEMKAVETCSDSLDLPGNLADGRTEMEKWILELQLTKL